MFSANRGADWELDPHDSEVFAVDVATARSRSSRRATARTTPPVVSPDGRQIAYLGFDDRLQGYQVTRLYVMDRDGAERARRHGDASTATSPTRAGPRTARGLCFPYDERGVRKLGYVSLDGEVRTLAAGRRRHRSRPAVRLRRLQRRARRPRRVHAQHAAAAGRRRGRARPAPARACSPRSTTTCSAHKTLGAVEEITWKSSHDGREIQGWIVKPPDFDPAKKYPLILEIHGGPFANYGPRFATEMQLYAAAGYVVLYANPRGSTSYGEEFGNLIHHAYPGHDYDDLMSGVDARDRAGLRRSRTTCSSPAAAAAAC